MAALVDVGSDGYGLYFHVVYMDGRGFDLVPPCGNGCCDICMFAWCCTSISCNCLAAVMGLASLPHCLFFNPADPRGIT